MQNAQQIHISIEKCRNVRASRIVVNAPDESPNTDGIHVADTLDIQISNCIIGTGKNSNNFKIIIIIILIKNLCIIGLFVNKLDEGDDCISIESGSEKVQATDITCGPGHGIRFGSTNKYFIRP